MTHGFVTLDTSYIKQHPKFTLDISMEPRLIRPHPYTNQPVVAVARGPIVYCVEDADHEWVTDHFKVHCLCLFPHHLWSLISHSCGTAHSSFSYVPFRILNPETNINFSLLTVRSLRHNHSSRNRHAYRHLPGLRRGSCWH